MTMRPVIPILLALAAAGSFAQEPAPSRETAAFRMLGLGAPVEGLAYLLDKKPVPVSAPEDSRSPFYALPAGGLVELVRMDKAPDGNPLTVPVARVDASKAGRLPLLVLVSGADGVSVEVLDDSLQAFPGGAYRTLNRLNQEVGLILAKTPTVIPALGEKVAVVKPDAAATTVFVQLYLLGGSTRKLFFSNNWAFSAGVRTLVVVAPPQPPSDLPLVRRIVEPVDALLPSKPPVP